MLPSATDMSHYISNFQGLFLIIYRSIAQAKEDVKTQNFNILCQFPIRKPSL